MLSWLLLSWFIHPGITLFSADERRSLWHPSVRRLLRCSWLHHPHLIHKMIKQKHGCLRQNRGPNPFTSMTKLIQACFFSGSVNPPLKQDALPGKTGTPLLLRQKSLNFLKMYPHLSIWVCKDLPLVSALGTKVYNSQMKQKDSYELNKKHSVCFTLEEEMEAILPCLCSALKAEHRGVHFPQSASSSSVPHLKWLMETPAVDPRLSVFSQLGTWHNDGTGRFAKCNLTRRQPYATWDKGKVVFARTQANGAGKHFFPPRSIVPPGKTYPQVRHTQDTHHTINTVDQGSEKNEEVERQWQWAGPAGPWAGRRDRHSEWERHSWMGTGTRVEML